jgi:hypothetical protein
LGPHATAGPRLLGAATLSPPGQKLSLLQRVQLVALLAAS